MFNSLKDKISLSLSNSSGWRTNRKIVVLESDDWGSIRMASKDVYHTLLKKGYPVHKNPYERYDSLASEQDLEMLFGVLTQFKDSNGNYPVITANTIVANPDFDKIKESGFNEYHFEYFTETLNRYQTHQNSFELWKQGMQMGIFHPQYHGREHLNVSKFMSALKNNDKDVHTAFEYRIPGVIPHGINSSGKNYYVEATRYDSDTDKKNKLAIFLEGYSIFERIFGYKSKTVIPTNYTWSPDYDTEAAHAGITTYQCSRKMKEPVFEGVRNNVYHKIYLGKTNEQGQKYMVRNAIFEPSLSGANKNSVEICLSHISNAFFYHKPAIITSHRVNYIGFIDETNRNQNLKELEKLLTLIIKKWPDVEFLTSAQLAELI